MSYQFELRHLRYFLAVAEVLHFKKAAEKLFISQPALSKQIKQLEEEIGFKLFERNNRKVELTPAGIYLNKELDGILNRLEESIHKAKLWSEGLEGNLRFGYVGSAIHSVIPPFLVAIRKRIPGVLFDLKVLDNARQIEAISKHEIDLGFIRQENVPKGIEIHPVYKDSFSLVIPRNHKINKSNFKSLLQFKEAPFILFDPSYSESYFNRVMQIFEDSGFQPLISHKTVHANTIYNLVENNFGISIIPTSLTKGYNMNIDFIELDVSKHYTTLKMIWSKHNNNPVLKQVLDMMVN